MSRTADQKRRNLARTMRQAFAGWWWAEPIGMDADERTVIRCPQRHNGFLTGAQLHSQLTASHQPGGFNR